MDMEAADMEATEMRLVEKTAKMEAATSMGKRGGG